MRIILFFCLILLAFNCEDTQSKKKSIPTSTQQKEKKKEAEEKNKSKLVEREFPKLTDENAMDFFLEYEKENKENKVRITTKFGEIDILLFNETKFHRANFIFLTKQKYFDGTQFYRIINNFMIQGGSSDESKMTKRRRNIGKYLLPTDTKRGFTHDRGVISMPSSEIENPHKLASPYQFFIVQKTSKHLDGDFTIFGKVIRGIDVVDEIAGQETDGSEWPLHNIYIKKVEIID